jgi:hypothetical protein
MTITPGRFGPLGYGSIDGRPGRFTARGYEMPGVTGLSQGRFGPNGYGADTSMWQSPGDCVTGAWTATGIPAKARSRKPRPYGVGAYGAGMYERYPPVEWARRPAFCSPGTWAAPV